MDPRVNGPVSLGAPGGHLLEGSAVDHEDIPGSGVYSGDGLSYHDRNYYVRTIAHNTLVVYSPNEDFSHARPDAVSNDGGQRTMYPASRSPTQSFKAWPLAAVPPLVS